MPTQSKGSVHEGTIANNQLFGCSLNTAAYAAYHKRSLASATSSPALVDYY